MTGDELFFWVIGIGYLVLGYLAITAEISFNKAKQKHDNFTGL